MDNVDIARRMQQQILGPKRFMTACGCIGGVLLYYPKKPWVFVDQWFSYCTGAWSEKGWFNKETGQRVTKEELHEAWRTACKRCDEFVVLGKAPWPFLMAKDGDIGMGPVHMPNPNPKKPEETWPPKMGEIFKKKTM